MLLQKADTLRLLKICIMFCPATGAKYPLTAGIFTSFYGHALVRLNVFMLSVGGNWIFFLKMWLKLEFIICFRCTQDTRRLAITKFLSKIIEQRVKLGTLVKIISNLLEVYVRKELQPVASVYLQILWKHFS